MLHRGCHYYALRGFGDSFDIRDKTGVCVEIDCGDAWAVSDMLLLGGWTIYKLGYLHDDCASKQTNSDANVHDAPVGADKCRCGSPHGCTDPYDVLGGMDGGAVERTAHSQAVEHSPAGSAQDVLGARGSQNCKKRSSVS